MPIPLDIINCDTILSNYAHVTTRTALGCFVTLRSQNGSAMPHRDIDMRCLATPLHSQPLPGPVRLSSPPTIATILRKVAGFPIGFTKFDHKTTVDDFSNPYLIEKLISLPGGLDSYDINVNLPPVISFSGYGLGEHSIGFQSICTLNQSGYMGDIWTSQITTMGRYTIRNVSNIQLAASDVHFGPIPGGQYRTAQLALSVTERRPLERNYLPP